MSEVSHAMPQSLRRVAKGEYAVKGTELRIVQGTDGKWRIEGHSVDLGAFASRGTALGKLQELSLVPAEQPKVEPPAEAQQQPEQPESKEQPKRRPRTRKPAKEAAKV
jgi:hypothetical protein